MLDHADAPGFATNDLHQLSQLVLGHRGKLRKLEAALDDANLGRLLELYEELRANSQLVVITHQKRTMEVADALYGVSMRGDGVSAVISQRLREEEPA